MPCMLCGSHRVLWKVKGFPSVRVCATHSYYFIPDMLELIEESARLDYIHIVYSSPTEDYLP